MAEQEESISEAAYSLLDFDMAIKSPEMKIEATRDNFPYMYLPLSSYSWR